MINLKSKKKARIVEQDRNFKGTVPIFENEDTIVPLEKTNKNEIKILNPQVEEKNKKNDKISVRGLVNLSETIEKMKTKSETRLKVLNRGNQASSTTRYNNAPSTGESPTHIRRPGLALSYISKRNLTKRITSISTNQLNTNSLTNNENEFSNNNGWISLIKKKIKFILVHNIELAIMCIATLFALFGLDLKILYLNPIYDKFFNYALVAVTALFFLELFASILVKQSYVKSFFFWLDLFASISMIFEIDSILYSTLGFILR